MVLNNFFLDPTKKLFTKYASTLQQINSIGKELKHLNDADLQKTTFILKDKLAKGHSESEIICEAFALVREASERVLGLRHYDVQLIGGLILNEGKIAEMKTGEGKTLVALLPIFFNALYGKGAHVITVNDYLARRDASDVGRVHSFLGLTVGLIQADMTPEERKLNYACDVTYVTNNELGFDYLRDNMAFTLDELVQRSFFYSVIDEVDSILIDEARTPLIISGSAQSPTEKYKKATKLANVLKRDINYTVDEKNQNITLLEEGSLLCEQALEISDLYNPEDPWISYILNALKAKELYILSTHYIINEQNEIIIIDEFTGRTMFGRRWSEGLHQAIEAKENVPIQDESQTLASITYQNLFLLYQKLSGMTGTGKTEDLEFEKIYNLQVIPIPTNVPVIRKDFPDVIYKTQFLKWQAVANECFEMYELGRPVLIGTTSIEKSELLAALLTEYEISFRILNARPEIVASESEIIAQAGCRQAITIATNMAGRGTDILLGGNPEYLALTIIRNIFEKQDTKLLQLADHNKFTNIINTLSSEELNFIKPTYNDFINDLRTESISSSLPDNPLRPIYLEIYEQLKLNTLQSKKVIKNLGGLHVIGTERHDSRRIDNQLRGRAGRQGDPGSSKFFLSLDDKLLRIFGGEKILDLMQNIGFGEAPIQSPLLNQSLESAQKKVEAYYYDVRKQLFEYDQALNMQRNCIYAERKRIIQQKYLREWVIEYAERTLYDLIFSAKDAENSTHFINQRFYSLISVAFNESLNEETKDVKVLFNELCQKLQIIYDWREIELETIETGLMRELERSFILQQIDYTWKEHLQKINFLRDSIKWRAYGQKDPLTEYKNEAFNFYVLMLTRIRHRIVYFTFKSKVLIEN